MNGRNYKNIQKGHISLDFAIMEILNSVNRHCSVGYAGPLALSQNLISQKSA